MSTFLPARPEARRRLAWSAAVVAALSLFNLMPISFAVLGSPWPLFLLWPVCGWTTLGPSLVAAFLLFCLGLWVDLITGGPIGMWALIALCTHGALLLAGGLISLGGLDPLAKISLAAGILALCCAIVAVVLQQPVGFLALLLPCLGAIVAYRFVGAWFEFEEDEA